MVIVMNRFFVAVAVAMAVAVVARAYERVDGVLSQSVIYPGTTHEYVVTVTDNYVPGMPCGLYVGLDGVLMDAPAVMDSLSRVGVIPPMVGVFLQPGVVKDGDGVVVRYNRSNEFDAIDGRFAGFVESELLPVVEGLRMPGGRVVVLPDGAERRMITGLSSGGMAALTAALRRPDLFGKVFSGCGTFVPMRGGEQTQVLIRKCEPAPLRVFLQDGYQDTWNPLFGSWFEANLLVASALEFSGVDVAHDWAEGGHSVVRATEIFPEVMRWMWRDFPARGAAAESGNETLRKILVSGRWWERAAATGAIHTPVTELVCEPMGVCVEYVPGSARLLQSVCDSVTGEKRFTQPFYWLHSLEGDDAGVKDMAMDGDGNLWVVTRVGVQICDQNGRVRAILRYPEGVEAEGISISDGVVTLYCGGGAVYTRQMNVKALNRAERPRSQGQA